MRLYHGSNCRISKVDLSFSRRYMDFGPGFYLTPDFQRAIIMANRAVTLNGNGNPEINPFIFNKSSCAENLSILEFKSCSWDWASFIIQNRDKSLNPPFEHDYDVVIGPVADSRVDPEIKKYKEEFSNQFMDPNNLRILAKRLKYPGRVYMQFCFCTNKALQFLYKD